MRNWKCFVLMPFADEFADVYLVLRDVERLPDIPQLNVFRADDISDPGRITDQVLAAIQGCDFVIADVTASNPNVMFELGYARALGRLAIIINQDVATSPFDIAEMRQIVYDRSRLVGDLRPQLIVAVKSVLAQLVRTTVTQQDDDPERLEAEQLPQAQQKREAEASKLESDSLSADEARAKLEAIEMEAEVAGEDRDGPRLKELGEEAKQTVHAVNLSAESPAALRTLAGEIGDVAVAFHNAKRYRDAEDIFNRALKLSEKHPGVLIQYALYQGLHRKDHAKAEELLKRSESLSGDLSRIEAARARLRAVRTHEGDPADPRLVAELKKRAESNPSSYDAFVPYMLVLQRTGAWDEVLRFGERMLTETGGKVTTEKGYQAHRAYADTIVLSDDPKHERKAITLYETILSHRPDDHEVLSNYATVMMKGSPSDQMKALRSYLKGYEVNPKQPILQRGFARALRQLLQRKDLAAKVLRSQPLTNEEALALKNVIKDLEGNGSTEAQDDP